MTKSTRYLFTLILIFSLYHFVRDVLQQFNLDNVFTDILHRPHYWCRPYCDIVTYPLDLLGILGSFYALKTNMVDFFGASVIVAMPLWFLIFILK